MPRAQKMVEEARDERVKDRREGTLARDAVFRAEAAPADIDGPVEEEAHEARLLGESVAKLRVDHFVDARHRKEHRRSDDLEVFRQVRDRAVEGEGIAQAQGQVVGGRTLEGVRERKEREELFLVVGQNVGERAAKVRENVAVREHHALGVAGRARRVDEGGEVVGFGTHRQILHVVAEREEGRELHHGNGRGGIVLDFVVRDDDEPQVGRFAGLADELPLEELVRHEHLRARIAQDEARGLRSVDCVKRHGNERVGEHRLVKADGFVAVGQEHRAAVAAFKEREGGEGLSPGEDVLEGFLEALFEPSLRLLVVELVGDGVGTLVEVVRQEFRERGKDVEVQNSLLGCVHRDRSDSVGAPWKVMAHTWIRNCTALLRPVPSAERMMQTEKYGKGCTEEHVNFPVDTIGLILK